MSRASLPRLPPIWASPFISPGTPDVDDHGNPGPALLQAVADARSGPEPELVTEREASGKVSAMSRPPVW